LHAGSESSDSTCPLLGVIFHKPAASTMPLWKAIQTQMQEDGARNVHWTLEEVEAKTSEEPERTQEAEPTVQKALEEPATEQGPQQAAPQEPELAEEQEPLREAVEHTPATDEGSIVELADNECTYQVVLKRVAVRNRPSTEGYMLFVLHKGERVRGSPCEVDGVPWLRLSPETLETHPLSSILREENSAWVLIDASKTDLGLGELLVRAPAELGWCKASPNHADVSAVWEVVGEDDLVVSTGKETDSEKEADLLAVGSLVKALSVEAGRLHYEIITGDGPEEGWVDIKKDDSEVLVQVSRRTPAPPVSLRDAKEQLQPQDPTKVEEALQHYCRQFMKRPEDKVFYQRQSFSWRSQDEAGEEDLRSAPEVRAELERDLGLGSGKQLALPEADEQSTAEGSDVETDELCCMCRLPLGELAYDSREMQGCVHGECMAQLMLQSMNREEESRRDKDRRRKQMRREEYDIGWKVERIPRNAGPAARLAGRPVQNGLIALLLEEGTNRLRAVPTLDPAASVNLEYLSVALKVRQEEGREALFSLDPVDPKIQDSMQVKRFEPYWLKGTNVGDVLFESDYHLKELSMGEYEQPVVGMKSCFDYSDEEDPNKEWSAREWFVVNRAEVQQSEDGVLIPYCKMGVEAREQRVDDKGNLEDVKVTRAGHPLVRYAEKFTHYFDLIAERKSVVFHLRELAKASILAKYLVENDVDLEPMWFELADDQQRHCFLEIPQLWNERAHSQIHVADGKIVCTDDGYGPSLRAVYGGVQFGLNRFRMAPAAGAAGAIAARRGIVPMGAAVTARRGFVPSRFTATRLQMPSTISASLGAMSASARGVDLELSKFNLDRTTPVVRGSAMACGADLDACVNIGSAFWTQIEGDAKSNFGDEQKSLLRDVFHPKLSDRRGEGELFIPPDTSYAYAMRLKSRVAEEKQVQQRRKDHFFSPKFVAAEPGSLFPTSWSSAFEISRGSASGKAQPPPGGLLHPRPDYQAQAALFSKALKSATPVFDKTAEDGLAFRIYRFGSLEVRTTQEPGGQEEIGAVFSFSQQAQAHECKESAGDQERIHKVTEYVENDASGNAHYYVTLETQAGNTIVTEKLRDGTVTWNENPCDSDDRNSMAKVLRSADCSAESITVHDMKLYQLSRTKSDTSYSARKRYSQRTYSRAAGKGYQVRRAETFAAFAARHCSKLRKALNHEEQQPLVV